MNEFQKAKHAVGELREQLDQAVKVLNDMEENTNRKELTDNELLQVSTFYRIRKHLEDALTEVTYLKKPILAEGTLYKNDQGRYAFDASHHFTSGAPIEIYIQEPC